MHEAPRDQVLLIGIALLLLGSLMASNFRGLGTWNARRAIESMTGAESLLRRVLPWKSMLREPLEDRVKRQVTVTRVVGVAFAVGGMVFILAAFGVGGPVYTNCC